MSYYIKTPTPTTIVIVGYDANKNYVDCLLYNNGNRVFNTNNSVRYIRLCTAGATPYGNTYNHDICINISCDLDGQYQPYVSHEYTLDDIDLRGILKLDGNNNLYYDGDTYESNGSVTRKYKEIDLSEQNWVVLSNRCYFNLPDIVMPADSYDLADCICKYEQVPASGTLNANDYAVLDYSGNAVYFYYDGTLPTGKFVYRTTTPTTETANPFTNPMQVDGNGTEEFVDGNLYERVDIGSLEWTYSSRNDANTGSVFYTIPSDAKANSIIVSDDFTNVDYPSWTDIAVNTGGFRNNYLILCADYPDAASFTTAMSGKYLIYEKATSVEMPVGHESYYANICPIIGHGGLNVFNVSDTDIKKKKKNVYEGKYSFVNLGDLNWVYGGGVFTTYDVNDFPFSASGWEGLTNFMCSKYSYSDWDLVDNPAGHDKQMCMRYVGGQYYTRVSDSDYTDVASFKAAMNGVYLLYELATPDTPSITETDFNNIVASFNANGQTFTVAFGQTVYGGVYDKSGRLTITHGIVDLGTLDWYGAPIGADTYFYAYPTDIKEPSDIYTVASVLTSIYSTVSWGEFASATNNTIAVFSNAIRILDTRFSDPNDFKTAMSGIMLAYELATPIEISVPSISVLAVNGTNNIFHDGNGDSEVKYLYKEASE